MSFNQNHMIHTGNYESFFLLYIDQELNDAQMKMVDEFLASHPELQQEFDLLVSTRLPMEHFSFDKESLMAENMHPGSVAEDLLLYLDDELPSDKKNIIEFELASNKDYQFQFKTLKAAKLDASEIIEYPNKKELYRRTERVIAFRPWMRVAAAIIIIAISGVIYLQKSDRPDMIPVTASTGVKKVNDQNNERIHVTEKQPELVNIQPNEMLTANTSRISTKKEGNKKDAFVTQEKNEVTPLEISNTSLADQRNPLTRVSSVGVADQASEITKSVAATFNPVLNIEAINKPGVTSSPADRTINDVANNDKKGSVKGFLRKATRLIEKRTGIDPTNEDGELLIGVVAMKLN
jgi:hypothetical protein